ncbi:MAG TPA: pyridoxal phosphate-dependent aminotransferase [Bryobacteraceae bacterium]|nr:pyridoxal phosphate-dependent aminotransferase [Bryobacteraceae bacterium]
MQLVKKMAQIGVESAFEVMVKARALEATGKSVIHLEIGEPDFPTPRNVIEAGKKALDEGWTKYGPTQGLPELRQSIASYISRTRGIKVGPQNVCVVPGGKPIMYFVIIALLEEGDEAIYPDPGFPIYESMIRFQGAKPVPIPLRESRGFSLDINELKDRLTDRTKLVILNSPHNPTGGIIPAGDIREIAAMLRERDIMVLSDEIYSRIIYDGEPSSIASADGMLDKTVILDGFSKTYSMTGWRLGYGVMPEWLAGAVVKLMVNSNSCTASFTQRAGIEALEGLQDAVDAMVAEFKRRRDAIVKGLNTIPGFRCPVPAGAFYVFPNVDGTGIGSKELADHLLYEGGVACLDGQCFGAEGRGYLRFSYANSLENILEAVERIRKVSTKWAAKVH